MMSGCVYVVLSPLLLPVLAPMGCSFGCAMARPSIMAMRLGSRSPTPPAPAPARATGMPPAATNSCRSRSCCSSKAPGSGQPRPGQRAWTWRRSASGPTPGVGYQQRHVQYQQRLQAAELLVELGGPVSRLAHGAGVQPCQLAQLPFEPGYAQGRYLFRRASSAS